MKTLSHIHSTLHFTVSDIDVAAGESNTGGGGGGYGVVVTPKNGKLLVKPRMINRAFEL